MLHETILTNKFLTKPKKRFQWSWRKKTTIYATWESRT